MSAAEELNPEENVIRMKAAINMAADALATGTRRTDEYHTEKGIVLKLKPLSQAILRRVCMNYPEPEPPSVEIKRSDGTTWTEPNPNDPDYEDELEAVYKERMAAVTRACVVLGTSVQTVPEGCHALESDDWIEELRFVGIEPDVSTAHARYAEWLTLYAFDRAFDEQACAGAVMSQSGVLEAEVARMVAFFRRRATRGADPAVPAAEGEPDGAGVSKPDPRPRKRGRGT